MDEWTLKAQLTLERFRVAELELLMQKHPFMDVWKTRGYEVDWHGFAQHYGIPTTLLDLTSNVEVAAFLHVPIGTTENKSLLRLILELA